VVDVQVGVANEADVAHAHAVRASWFSIMFSWKLQAAHAERFHDLIGTVASVTTIG